MIDGIIRHNAERRHPKNDSVQLWFKVALQFQRRRFVKRFTTMDGCQVIAKTCMTLWVTVRWVKK